MKNATARALQNDSVQRADRDLAVRRGAKAPDVAALEVRVNAVQTRLTARQCEVLILLSEGCSNKTISERLEISGATVKIHISGVFRALGVTSRLQAVLTAARHGLLDCLPDASVPAVRAVPRTRTRIIR